MDCVDPFGRCDDIKPRREVVAGFKPQVAAVILPSHAQFQFQLRDDAAVVYPGCCLNSCSGILLDVVRREVAEKNVSDGVTIRQKATVKASLQRDSKPRTNSIKVDIGVNFRRTGNGEVTVELLIKLRISKAQYPVD